MVLKLCVLAVLLHTAIGSPTDMKVTHLFYAQDEATKHARDRVSTERPKGRTLIPPIENRFTAPTHCQFDDGSKGHCVQSYLCADGNILTDGRTLITERKYECQSPEVCCRHEGTAVEPTPPSIDKKKDRAEREGSTLVPPVDVNAFRPRRCEFEDGRQGHCVEPTRCRKINRDGAGLITERHLQCWNPEICCELDHEKITDNTPHTLVPPIKDRKPGDPCEAYDGSQGRCVLVHLCTNSTAINDGSGLITERHSDPCVVWRGGIQLCCPAKYLIGKHIPDIDATTEISTRTNDKDNTCVAKNHSQGLCVPYYQCDDDFDGSGVINDRYQGNCKAHNVCCIKGKVDKTKKPPTTSDKKSCGMVNKDGVVSSTEVQPLEAKFGEFPWMVAIRTKTSRFPENYNTTGGSLIHPSVVLTVAHYVLRALDQDVRVRAGEWNILDVDELLPHQEVGVKTIVAHPDFNKSNYRNDIALLFLETPIKMVLPHIGVACLPPANDVVAPSTDCVANGWGKDRHGTKGLISNILKKLTLPAVDHQDCQTRLRTTRLGPFFELHDGFMCAGGERLDTCALDGGSPLTCPTETDPNRHIQYGVVAWGIDCHTEAIPGVYMNVAYYRNWIDDHMKAEGLDTSVYTAQ